MTPPPRPQRWLLRRPKGDAPTRLFCLPYSGVGASMYHRWPRVLGPAEVCLVQLPGRENRVREPHYGTYEELAGRLAEGLLPHLDRPFAFFGHCGGALPGFATALHLVREGLPAPDRLFVSSSAAPHDGPFGRFHDMSDTELAEELAELARAMGGDPHPDLIEMNLGVLRQDLAAGRRYRLDKPVRLPAAVHAIGWDADREIQLGQMGGWAEYAEPDRFHPTELPGRHYAFLDAPEPLLQVLAEGMQRTLAESGGARGPVADA